MAATGASPAGLLSTSPRFGQHTPSQHTSSSVTWSGVSQGGTTPVGNVLNGISSRDSLDSGVYSSRSTTCDSSLSSGSNAKTSPLAATSSNNMNYPEPIRRLGGVESPPHSPSWRRSTGKLLPELPVSSVTPSNGYELGGGYSSVRSLPSQDSSEDSLDYNGPVNPTRYLHYIFSQKCVKIWDNYYCLLQLVSCLFTAVRRC